MRVTFGGMTIIRYACLFANDGRIWVFAHVLDKGKNRLVCRQFDGQRWLAFGDVADLGDLRGPAQIALAPGVSRSASPFVLWSVRDHSAQDARIRASSWNGKSWPEPEDTPGLMSGGGTHGLVVWKTKPHIWAAMYTGNLRPPESYPVGVDGWFPVKPFYMELGEHAWSDSSAMASASRRTYADLAVVTGKARNKILAVLKYADRLKIRPAELALGSVTADGKWCTHSRIGDAEGHIHSPSGGVDGAGVLHVAYDVFSRRKQQRVTRYRTMEGDRWSGPKSLGQAAHRGAVGGDREGNVYAYWVEGDKTALARRTENQAPEAGYVRVVSDGRGSAPIKAEPLDGGSIYPAPGAGVFLVGKSDSTTLVIRAVTLTGE